MPALVSSDSGTARQHRAAGPVPRPVRTASARKPRGPAGRRRDGASRRAVRRCRWRRPARRGRSPAARGSCAARSADWPRACARGAAAASADRAPAARRSGAASRCSAGSASRRFDVVVERLVAAARASAPAHRHRPARGRIASCRSRRAACSVVQRLHQRHVVVAALGQPELGGDVARDRRRRTSPHSDPAPPAAARRRSNSGASAPREAAQVPLRHVRLLAEAVAAALRVGGVRRPVAVVSCRSSRTGRSRW